MPLLVKATVIPASGGRSYSRADWESKKGIISDLYGEGLKQDELLQVLASEHAFRPTSSMLKKRIFRWQIDRKNKEATILAALRICLARKQLGKRTSFKIKSRIVDENEINRYLRRKGVRDRLEYAASDLQADATSVIPFTPPETPEAPKLRHPVRKPNARIDGGDTTASISPRHNQLAVQSRWPVQTIRGVAISAAVDFDRNVAGIYDLTSTEHLLFLNAAYYDMLDISCHQRAASACSHDGFTPWPACPELKTFTNGMWRGRDLLLERSTGAVVFFNEAFSVVGTLLRGQDRRFLIELYEMILNFQLDERRDILWNLLNHIDEMSVSNEALATQSWPLGEIGKRLKCMPMQDRIETAECLLRDLLARQTPTNRNLQDTQEGQSIRKTLSRSKYRRKPMEKAIVHLTELLATTSLEAETGSYERCGLLVELALLHRFLDRPEKAIWYLKLAWQSAFWMTEIYGCTDVRIRCLRTISLIELKRGNYYLSAQLAQEAVCLARKYLGIEESLTSLVEAELAQLASTLSSLNLDMPCTPIDVEAVFKVNSSTVC